MTLPPQHIFLQEALGWDCLSLVWKNAVKFKEGEVDASRSLVDKLHEWYYRVNSFESGEEHGKTLSKGGSHYLAPLDPGHLEKWTYFARSYNLVQWNLEIQIFVQYCFFF